MQTLKPRITMAGTSRVSSLGESWRDGKRSSTARGYGYAWQKRRERHLREHPLCVYCLKANLVTPASVADHITPHRGDPAMFAGPLQSLCASCHSSAKAMEEGGI